MTPSSRFLFPDMLLPVTSVFGPWRRHVDRNKRLEIQLPGLDQAGPGLIVLWQGTALHSNWPLCQVGPGSVTPRTKGDHSKHPALAPRTPSGLLGLDWARVTPQFWNMALILPLHLGFPTIHPS